MDRQSLVLSLACAACLLAIDGPAAAARTSDRSDSPDPARESRDWKVLETESLTVMGNARPDALLRAGREIERFRLSLREIAPSLRLDSPVPTRVIVFRDDSALTPFKPRSRGKPRDNVAAYFAPQPDVNYIVMAPSRNREFTYRVIFHEYTHFIINRNIRRLPLWLNEGLAEFYSTFSGSERDGRTMIGRPIEYHVARMATTTAIPLRKLIDPAAQGDLLRGAESTARFYAHAWALTHYLLLGDNGARRPLLGRYLLLLQAGKAPDVTFKEVFGPDLEPIDRGMRRHATNLTMPALQLAQPPDASPETPRKMLDADARQVQGDLLIRLGDLDAGDEFVAQALEQDRLHVGARLSRARSLLGRDKAADAVDILSAPDLEASSDFGVQLLRADALRRSRRHEAAVAAYRQAIALQPESPWPFYGLSMAQLALGDAGTSASFTRCMMLQPGAEWYVVRLYEALRLGLDKYAATDALNYVRQAGWQSETSTYVMLNGAIALLRQNKPKEAEAFLSDVEQHVGADEWPASIVAFLKGALTGDALLRRAKGDGQLTEAHASVGSKANIEGRPDEARQHLIWVRDRGRKDYVEYGLALGELKRLDEM